jgi:hypothetical protein
MEIIGHAHSLLDNTYGITVCTGGVDCTCKCLNGAACHRHSSIYFVDLHVNPSMLHNRTPEAQLCAAHVIPMLP